MADLAANGVEVIRSTALGDLRHGFLGRIGGISTGDVAGLQVGLSAGDDDRAVAENRRRAVEAVAPGAQLVTVQQVHSATAVTADRTWPENDRPRADAIVTATKGLVLAIVTADCAPVLFADRKAGVIGAAHAGWRGAHGGVVEETVAAMKKLGANTADIVAAVGPCIAQPSYEVSADFREEFAAGDERFFAAGKPGKWQFDLESYVACRLARCGIAQTDCLHLDTYSHADRFFSHRRSVHREEPAYGRQFSLIAL